MPHLGLPTLSVDPVLFLPLWLGTLRDQMGHTTTLSGTPYWAARGAVDHYAAAANGRLIVADTPDLQFLSGTIFIAGTFVSDAGIGRFYSKRDAGGTHMELLQSAVPGRVIIGNTHANIGYLRASSIAATWVNGEVPVGYADAVPTAAVGAINLTANDAPVVIGNMSIVVAHAPNKNPFGMVVAYPGALSAPEIAELHAYSQSLITPRKQWPGGGLRYPDRGDPYVPATGDPMYIDNIQSARVTLADQTSGQLSNTGLQIITGTWALTESAAGRAITCVGAGKLRRRLIGADGFTTHRFVGTGAAALTKNATNIEIDAGNGDTITAVHLTAP